MAKKSASASAIRKGATKTPFTAGETFKGGSNNNTSTYSPGRFKDYSLTKSPAGQMGRNSK